MTPFLALVLTGFGLFVVVLGFVATRDQLSRVRVRAKGVDQRD